MGFQLRSREIGNFFLFKKSTNDKKKDEREEDKGSKNKDSEDVQEIK